MKFDACLKVAAEQTAADYGISPSLFFDGTTHVVRAENYSARARRTKLGKPFLDISYFGSGLVAVADDVIIDDVKAYLAQCKDAFRAFDAPNVFELDAMLGRFGYTVGELAVGFLPADGNASRRCALDRASVKTLFDKEISELYRYKEFGEALCYDVDAPRRDVIAVIHRDGGRPIAVAACSNDCEDMYQIGVDVLPEYRRRGIAAALVTELTALIEERGKVPFYRCAWSNIASRRTATACGYVDAWIELFACKKKM